MFTRQTATYKSGEEISFLIYVVADKSGRIPNDSYMEKKDVVLIMAKSLETPCITPRASGGGGGGGRPAGRVIPTLMRQSVRRTSLTQQKRVRTKNSNFFVVYCTIISFILAVLETLILTQKTSVIV